MSTVSDTQLAWLAGIIDGEGCIGVYSYKPKGRPNIIHTPVITITNTNVKIVEKVDSILGTMGILHYISKPRAAKHCRLRMDIKMTKSLPIYVLLQKLKPYLVGKAEHAQYMQEYIWENSKQFRGYSTQSLCLIDKLKQLNKRGLDAEIKRQVGTKELKPGTIIPCDNPKEYVPQTSPPR